MLKISYIPALLAIAISAQAAAQGNNSMRGDHEYRCGEDTACIREINDELVNSSAASASRSGADYAVREACYLSSGTYRFHYVVAHYPESHCAEVARSQVLKQERAQLAREEEENARLAEAKAKQQGSAREAAANRANSLLPPEQVQEVSGMMFGAYYEGGPALMFRTENQCWLDVPSREPERSAVAAACALATTAGAMIEAAYAQQEGRMPVLNYNAGMSTDRAKGKMKATGLSDAEIATIYAETVGPNMDMLLFGLMNAGMR